MPVIRKEMYFSKGKFLIGKIMLLFSFSMTQKIFVWKAETASKGFKKANRKFSSLITSQK